MKLLIGVSLYHLFTSVVCLFVCLQPFAFDPPEGFMPIQEAESEHLVQAAGELLG